MTPNAEDQQPVYNPSMIHR